MHRSKRKISKDYKEEIFKNEPATKRIKLNAEKSKLNMKKTQSNTKKTKWNMKRTKLNTKITKSNTKRTRLNTKKATKKTKLNSDDLSSLHQALKYNDKTTVDDLLKKGVSVFEKDNKDFSALYYAVQSNSRIMIRKVLNKGVSVNEPQGQHHQSVLCFAIKDNLSTSVDFLLDNKCNVNMRNAHVCGCFGGTPFMHALEAGKVKWVKRMLKQGAEVNKIIHKNKMPLQVAIDEGHTQVARCLLAHGASLEAKVTLTTQSFLHVAARKSEGMVKLLVDSGWKDIDVKDAFGVTPLFEALHFDRYEEAKALLDAGANVNHVDDIRRSVLHVARSPKLVNLLVKRGADVNAKDYDGNIPLLKWALVGRVGMIDPRLENNRVIEPLIRAGSNLDDTNKKGLSFREFCRELGPASSLFKVAGKFISIQSLNK